MKKLLLMAALLLGPLTPAIAANMDKPLVDNDAAAIDALTTLDLSNVSRFSAQAVYSDGTPAAHTFTDGKLSTATLTVTDYTALDATAASVTVTLASYTALSDAVLTVNGVRFKEGGGGSWDVGASSAATATSLASAIDANSNFSASASFGVVTISAANTGTGPNSWTITSSTDAAMTPSASTFSGGLFDARIAISTVFLIQGTDWDAETSSATTASNIINAINANSTLSAIVTASSSTAGVVDLVTVSVGSDTNYDLFTSTPAALNWNGDTADQTLNMVEGADSDVDVSADSLSEANHGLTTGLAVLYSTPTVGTNPGGLVGGTTYYAIKSTKDLYKLATSTQNAVDGTAVDITGVTGSGTFTITPLSLNGAPSFKWQVSNDNSNWNDIAVSSFTWSSAGSTAWDFGQINYKWIRVNYTHPNPGQGGLDLVIRIFGRLER